MADLLDDHPDLDPCLVWPDLMKAYYRRLKGDTEVRVKLSTQAGHTEEVEFGDVNPDKILAQAERLKAACARKSGKRLRYAMTGRFRRRDY